MTDSYNLTDENLAKLEELLAAMKEGKAFALEVDGERVEVPAHADIEIEYEREDGEHELEIQIYWESAEDEDEEDEDEEAVEEPEDD